LTQELFPAPEASGRSSLLLFKGKTKGFPPSRNFGIGTIGARAVAPKRIQCNKETVPEGNIAKINT